MKWLMLVFSLFCMFWAGVFFDDFMITNRTSRLFGAITFLSAAIMSTKPPKKKKIDELKNKQ